jgi:hypothetical protein
MLIVIILLALILVLATLFNKNNDTFVSAKKMEFTISRPNCTQLNDHDVCINTPGCFSTDNGCINNYAELQEPQKPWEKDDFMIVY